MDRHADQALHQSEERFRLLVRAVREYAIFMLDPQGYIVSWNTGAQLIKGYTDDEIIGRHFSIFPAEAVAVGHPAHELQRATREGVYEEEGWRVRKDGSLFWANVVITALLADDGTLRGFGKVTRDLTERKQAEDAQRQLRAAAMGAWCWRVFYHWRMEALDRLLPPAWMTAYPRW
jgi:PAS domain S-box-containing protein